MNSLGILTFAFVLGGPLAAARAAGNNGPPPPPPNVPARPPHRAPLPPAVPPAPQNAAPSTVASALSMICTTPPPGALPELAQICAQRASAAVAQPEPAFPPGYYSARYHVDVCKAAQTLPENGPTSDAVLTLHRLCGTGENRAGSLTTLGVQLVQGLGDFMVARAKQEVVNYAVEMNAESLCDGAFKEYLPKSCAVLFPPPPGSPPDLGSATDGRLQTAIREDLMTLPGEVLVKAISAAKPGINDALLTQVLQAIGTGAILTIQNHDLRSFFKEALAQLPLPPAAGQTFACRLDTNPSPSTAACVATFTLEVGSTAIAEPNLDPMRIINDAASSFCSRFGPAPTAATTPGQCVFGSADYPAIQTQALGVIETAASLADVADQVAIQMRQSTLSATDTLAKVGPTMVAGLRTTINAVAAATRALQPAVGAPPVSAVLAIIEDVVSLVGAVAARDGSDALAATERLVSDAAKLDPKLPLDSKTFAFVLAIATAKSRDDVEAALEAAADPLGSYRMKYGPHSAGHVTINGFVGPTAGLHRPLNRVGAVDLNQRFARLSAPVGLDVNFYGWNYTNLGMGLRLIDPLALTVVTQQTGTVTANWASLVDLGAYLRVGLARSPFSFLMSFDYLPGLEPSNGCQTSGTSPCWRGAWQLGGSISIDIPILTIH